VREAICVPAEELDVTYSDAAVDAALAFCEGHPWYVQLLGSQAWKVAKTSPIAEADIALATERAQSLLEEGFFPSMVRSLPRDLSDVTFTFNAAQ